MAGSHEYDPVTDPEDRRRTSVPRARNEGAQSPGGLERLLRSVADERPSGRALDVATGTGRNAISLAAHGWTVEAIDISRSQLERARSRAAERSLSIDWILADVDSYCFPAGRYDLVTVSFFDARDRLPALIDALAPGGCLWYEHYLESSAAESGPGDRYRFEPNELLAACSELSIVYYAEYRVDGEPRVTLLARNEDTVSRYRPPSSAVFEPR
ncbi:class I SAM-dependent methyltransferase [Natronolimnohabitans sp. A-GB9]|uniref:class I SAM-dependent methyltransferase n=1 Tax=Natronolimnohabitans sp. A-GB9 TaxID=3069757 RepID=UPI0027AE28FE|nr:class I SAM-dependent methyltransferase [Natronolimnohabitans sp. A-GB9]MDQ2050755.1 class I SAM-dependent methyltransferase [Natronolimnohabitans sp. A-GB9]